MMNPSRLRSELLAHLAEMRAFAACLAKTGAAGDALVGRVLVSTWRERPSCEPHALRIRLFASLHEAFRSKPPDAALELMPARTPATRGPSEFGEALHGLPDDEREAVTLVGACDFSFEEAADICGCAPDTVRERVERAFARLREVLGSGSGSPAA
jgi:RNA polymerase sigma-70 factor (ECF subfamily)